MFPETIFLNTLLHDHHSGCATAKLSYLYRNFLSKTLMTRKTHCSSQVEKNPSHSPAILFLFPSLPPHSQPPLFRLLSKEHILTKFCTELQKLKMVFTWSFKHQRFKTFRKIFYDSFTLNTCVRRSVNPPHTSSTLC